MKIATFNISHCQDYSVTKADDAPVDIEKYARYIKSLNVDVIALNEVFLKSEIEDYNKQGKKLAQLAGYSYIAEAVGADLGVVSIGNVILSKYPIESVESFPVLAPLENERREEENEWYENRVILSVVINVEGKKVRVISTHFGLNGLEKERMIAMLCPIIDISKEPIVFLGDFNAQPHTEILLPIYDRLKSCAAEKHNQEYTFSSFGPYITIDYIFISSKLNVNMFEIKKEILSDHRACLAEIEF